MKKIIAILLAAGALMLIPACAKEQPQQPAGENPGQTEQPGGEQPGGEQPGGEQPQEITLSFGQDTAYFTGRTELYPVSGEEPATDDPVERATVTINASGAAKMQLSLEYVQGMQDIRGLVISANGGAAADVENGMVLYTSAAAETTATIEVEIYLEQSATYEDTAGKTLQFVFVLEQVE